MRKQERKKPPRAPAERPPEAQAADEAVPERTARPPVLPRPEAGLVDQPTATDQAGGEMSPDRRWETVRDAARADRLDAGAWRREAARDEAEADLRTLDGDVVDGWTEEARVDASHLTDPQEREDAFDAAEDLQVQADAKHHDAEPLYDSAQRREATARDLEARGIDRELVSRQMLSDVSQAAPAARAPTTAAQPTAARRTSRARGARGPRRPGKGIQRG